MLLCARHWIQRNQMVQRQTTNDSPERMCSTRVSTGLGGGGEEHCKSLGRKAKDSRQAPRGSHNTETHTWSRRCAWCQETGWEWGRKGFEREEFLQGLGGRQENTRSRVTWASKLSEAAELHPKDKGQLIFTAFKRAQILRQNACHTEKWKARQQLEPAETIDTRENGKAMWTLQMLRRWMGYQNVIPERLLFPWGPLVMTTRNNPPLNEVFWSYQW